MRTILLALALVFVPLFARSQTKTSKAAPDVDKALRAATNQAIRQVLAEDAQRKFSTDAGHAYILEFVRSISSGVIDSMHACDTADFKSNASDMIIFVVSADGHIEMLFHDLNNPYAQCIAQHLHLPKNVPKPPAKSWPVQVRVLNGPRKTTGPDEPYVTLSLPDKH